MSLQSLIDWLAATQLSETIQNVTWIIPLVQTIHILSIAIVTSSVLMIDLRIFGLFARDQTLSATVRRFLPWVWYTLIVLLVTGTLLIIGEPNRSLRNPAFGLKMAMLAIVLIFTLIFQKGLERGDDFWNQSPRRRIVSRSLVIVSLLLWTCIVFAGRMIAYVSTDSA